MLDLNSRTPTTQASPAAAVTRLLRRAAWAFTTRRVPRRAPWSIVRDAGAPKPGDVILARVDAIGHHGRLQLANGRRKNLFVGDEIVVAYGNRYAPNQFEAVVPETLGPCHLVAGGGIAGKALSWHGRISKVPTQITPLGFLADGSGGATNLRHHALPPVERLVGPCPTAVAVVGTAMDSGKTQTAAYLVKGLTRAGARVGYAKVTGTGAGGDTWLLRDAGADPVLDFTDAGLASTYLVPPAEIEQVFATLMTHLGKSGVDAVVLEVADGVLQGETAALLTSEVFRSLVGGIVFAASDSMGAVAGDHWLRSRGLPILALSGVLTSAPLLRQEASRTTGRPVFSRRELARANTAMKILSWAEAGAAPEERGAGDDPTGERPVLDIASSA